MNETSFISLWGSMAEMARAIGEAEVTVRAWFNRRSIPAKYDQKIIAAANERGLNISPIEMHELRVSLAKQEDAA